jgi:hypothetical protein
VPPLTFDPPVLGSLSRHLRRAPPAVPTYQGRTLADWIKMLKDTSNPAPPAGGGGARLGRLGPGRRTPYR